jgi:3-isopropylmalate/(R)-2-methylmalate dehydratase small subunit
MEPFVKLTSRTVVMPAANIDTDQIIPARFLTTTTRAGLGAQLFADWRYDPAGAARAEFVLNRPEAQGCRILVAGDNFGCGSSREHAPWALLDFGLRAVISTRFADIFASNALKNGLLPLSVDAETHAWLIARPGAEVTVDLASEILMLPDAVAVNFALEPFARHCLLAGIDELGFLLGEERAIAAYERSRA